MKLKIRNAILLLAFGTVIVIVGAFLKMQNRPYFNSVLISGLFLSFVGSLALVVSLYHKRKS